MNEIKRKISFHDYFRNGSVLIVDDMANMRRTIKNILRHLGIDEEQVLQANDGDVALKMLHDEKQHIIFVLLDWNMPRVSGITVLKEMKEDEKLRNIPVLMITAENNESQILEAVEYEVKNYLIKPFVSKTLLEKMMNVINPPEYLQWIHEGEELMNKGEYDKALAILKGVLKTKPDSASVRILMGKVYEGKKDYEKAQQLYEEAAGKNPQYLKAHNTLAALLLKTGKKQEALHSLEKAAKISPINPDRQIAIGNLALESEGDVEKAQRAFEAVIRQSPERANDIAEIYLKNGKAEEAEMFFRNALSRKVSIHLYNRLGIALRQQEKWKEAIVEYTRALEIEPQNDILFYNMGMAYLEGNKKEDAIQRFKKALEHNPGFADPKKMLEKLGAS